MQSQKVGESTREGPGCAERSTVAEASKAELEARYKGWDCTSYAGALKGPQKRGKESVVGGKFSWLETPGPLSALSEAQASSGKLPAQTEIRTNDLKLAQTVAELESTAEILQAKIAELKEGISGRDALHAQLDASEEELAASRDQQQQLVTILTRHQEQLEAIEEDNHRLQRELEAAIQSSEEAKLELRRQQDTVMQANQPKERMVDSCNTIELELQSNVLEQQGQRKSEEEEEAGRKDFSKGQLKKLKAKAKRVDQLEKDLNGAEVLFDAQLAASRESREKDQATIRLYLKNLTDQSKDYRDLRNEVLQLRARVAELEKLAD